MDHKAWFRIVVFTAMFVLFFWLVYHDVADRIQLAQYGQRATATVIGDKGAVRRGGRRTRRLNYVALIQYDGRTATLESSSRRPVGSQIEIQYVPRPGGDLVRVPSEDRSWSPIMFLGLGAAYVYLVVQEFRGKSWWASR